MLKRKIEDTLVQWKNASGHKPLVLTLPTYMQFLLDLEPEELVLEPIDTTALNSLAREILGKDD